jgi:hypothetical protein
MIETLPQPGHRIHWKVEAVLKARGELKLSAPRLVEPSLDCPALKSSDRSPCVPDFAVPDFVEGEIH